MATNEKRICNYDEREISISSKCGAAIVIGVAVKLCSTGAERANLSHAHSCGMREARLTRKRSPPHNITRNAREKGKRRRPERRCSMFCFVRLLNHERNVSIGICVSPVMTNSKGTEINELLSPITVAMKEPDNNRPVTPRASMPKYS